MPPAMMHIGPGLHERVWLLQKRSPSNTKQCVDVPVQPKYYIGGSTLPGELAQERDITVVHTRLAAAK